MKERINRLAKGIIDEDVPVLLLRPEALDEPIFMGKQACFALEFESVSGSSMRGICCSDEPRITFASPSFMGRVVHETFTVETRGLEEGEKLDGSICLITNAGEYVIPYHFTVKRSEGALFGRTFGRPPVTDDDAAAEADASADVSGVQREASPEQAGAAGDYPPEEYEEVRYRALLASAIPDDDELFEAVCTMLIREEAAGGLAFALLEEAVNRGLELTHLYESFLASWPEDKDTPMPREVLLYFSYEKNLPPLMADRLYRNVICHEPEGSELYRVFEPGMRDHAAKSLSDRRMNDNLSYIYNRILYPDMIDAKAAAILPDILRANRIRVHSRRAVTVHVKYPEMKRICSERLKDGRAYVPVYFPDAQISFYDADGTELELPFESRKMMDRPDLLRRCFELVPDHPMLQFTAIREILNRGIRSEEEKMILVNAMSGQDLEPEFREELIRSLVRAGGDSTWIDRIPVSEMNRETGQFAFRAFLNAGRRQDAYIYLKGAGTESFEAAELSALATGLIAGGQKPVTPTGQTDAFFLCLCKKVFDEGQASEQIMDVLTAEYGGATEEMFQILREADENRLPVHDLPERILTMLLFEGNRSHLDETFRIYLKKEIQKETLLRAFFTFRMTDYIEREDRSPDIAVFEALTSYFSLTRFPETLPVICMIGLTRYYSEKETLTARETDLCQKLTDILISRNLIFAYTKKLRKKIRIPASVCERFYVEYVGGRSALPRMLAKILPDSAEYRPVSMVRVFRNVFVASTVLFMGEEMHYLVYDDAFGPDPVQQGVITVKKMHGKEENRFLMLNRMTKALEEREFTTLQNDMLQYALDTEVNRGLFEIGE